MITTAVAGIMKVVRGIATMIRKGSMKKHLTKQFFKFLLWKILAMSSAISAAYFIVFMQDKYLWAVILFIATFYFTSKYSRMEPYPILANCLKNSNSFISIYATISMGIAPAILVFGIVNGFNNLQYSTDLFFGLLLCLFGSGVFLYLKECKKCGVLQ